MVYQQSSLFERQPQSSHLKSLRSCHSFGNFDGKNVSRQVELSGACMTDTITEVRISTSSLQTYPTGPFTILEPQDQEISKFCVGQERRVTDLVAPNL